MRWVGAAREERRGRERQAWEIRLGGPVGCEVEGRSAAFRCGPRFIISYIALYLLAFYLILHSVIFLYSVRMLGFATSTHSPINRFQNIPPEQHPLYLMSSLHLLHPNLLLSKKSADDLMRLIDTEIPDLPNHHPTRHLALGSP
jgi:hypothetical protein